MENNNWFNKEIKEVEEILNSGANEVRELAKAKFDVMKKNIGLYR